MTQPSRYTHTGWQRHLRGLLEAGPCPMPPTDACSWMDPDWLDAWMRNNPDHIRHELDLLAQITTRRTLTRPRPAAAPRTAPKTAPAPPVPTPDEIQARRVAAYAHKNGLSIRQATDHLARKARP